MVDKSKPIWLSGHAQEQMSRRGYSFEEVKDAIHTASWKPAGSGRLECNRNFPYNKEWNKKQYATKRVRPIFVEEPEGIIVVTVYTYYF
ncbi:MAG: DUF4258 domain-containing protein [Planctomycetota bacterium]|nr:DUF4258 domain-containing protein [Planctomycetota bacterium]